MGVLKVVNIDELIDIINKMDTVCGESYPVIFRNKEDNSVITKAGFDRRGYFIWKDNVLGKLMQLNIELWENVRLEKIFHEYLDGEQFEILTDSFKGTYI